jgi:predicted N-acetyltransferase YhbS
VSIVVRHATAGDIPVILDLLTEYDLPRSYFEPRYLADPTYRPEHSWLVTVDGQIVAHLRLFDRWMRAHETTLHIAGVGNVITARSFRGQGHSARLLRAMISEATVAGFAYSLLWTHLPDLYRRFGWVLIRQDALHGVVHESPIPPDAIAAFRLSDLPEVMCLYDQTNSARSGSVVRSADYWRAQLVWLHEDLDGFLLLRHTDDSLAGYVRSRAQNADVEILELGLAPNHQDGGRALVARVARKGDGRLQAHLPPSLADVIPADGVERIDDGGLMGRVLNLEALLKALRPVLRRRARSTRAAVAHLDGGVPGDLSEAELGHLLFHGYDAQAAEMFDGQDEAEVLRALFPPQDFVIWPADAF